MLGRARWQRGGGGVLDIGRACAARGRHSCHGSWGRGLVAPCHSVGAAPRSEAAGVEAAYLSAIRQRLRPYRRCVVVLSCFGAAAAALLHRVPASPPSPSLPTSVPRLFCCFSRLHRLCRGAVCAGPLRRARPAGLLNYGCRLLAVARRGESNDKVNECLWAWVSRRNISAPMEGSAAPGKPHAPTRQEIRRSGEKEKQRAAPSPHGWPDANTGGDLMRSCLHACDERAPRRHQGRDYVRTLREASRRRAPGLRQATGPRRAQKRRAAEPQRPKRPARGRGPGGPHCTAPRGGGA